MTGLYPHTNGCTHNNIPLRPDTPTIAELLKRRADYVTAYHGKWHIGVKNRPADYGYEGEFYPKYGYAGGRSKHYDAYLKTSDTERTRYGGSEVYSKIDMNPIWKRLFAGYGFGVDYREEHGHAYSLSDQKETLRTKQQAC